MPAGRPRKPTKLLELSGAFKHNPDRALDRAEEPRPLGEVGDPPDTLSAGGKKCWVEIVSLLPFGVAFDSDRVALEQYAETLAFCRMKKWRYDKGVDSKVLVRMEAMYARFGMTPADRSRIKVKAPEKKNDTPFSEFGKPRAVA